LDYGATRLFRHAVGSPESKTPHERGIFGTESAVLLDWEHPFVWEYSPHLLANGQDGRLAVGGGFRHTSRIRPPLFKSKRAATSERRGLPRSQPQRVDEGG
jgi:hypothetical protein